jgi:hypothetical protein
MGTMLYAKEHKHLSYEVSLSLLTSIDRDAVILGTGEKIVYVFIDPLCPHSRKFVKMVSQNPLMLSKYRYHLLLYSIPRLKSTDVVSSIYQLKNPIETLLKTMVEKKILYTKANEMTKEKVNRIASVGKKIDVYKRPYLFIVK